MADEYKKKLEDFISDIPKPPGQIVSGEAKKPPYDAAFKKQLEDPKFNLPTTELFMKYTGTSHKTLVTNWSGGGIMTTCNGFVGVCGKAMGAKDFLGQFELEAFLKKIGKGHSWTPSNGENRPEYGDLFRAASFHMGVSLGFEGDEWLTVEAGQGGSISGFDIIKRKQHPFNPKSLLGWCDMKLYLDPRPGLPDWLPGTWIIYCGDQTFNYRFNKYSEAFFYPRLPVGNPENAVPSDIGKIEFQGFDSFNVSWSKEGGIERFTYDRYNSFPGIMEKVTGESSRGEKLKGVRL
ncbi:MAG: hypothetical protein H7Z37_18645 [Pyrinomonadaceae bacterium]|nr:hypothetical protein [Pyrinomonadaceae bacterium]